MPGPAGGAAPAHMGPQLPVCPRNHGTETQPCPASVLQAPAFWSQALPQSPGFSKQKAASRGSEQPAVGDHALSRVGASAPEAGGPGLSWLPSPTPASGPSRTHGAQPVESAQCLCQGGAGVWPVRPALQRPHLNMAERSTRPLGGGGGCDGDPAPQQQKHLWAGSRLRGPRPAPSQQDSAFHRLPSPPEAPVPSRPEPTSHERDPERAAVVFTRGPDVLAPAPRSWPPPLPPTPGARTEGGQHRLRPPVTGGGREASPCPSGSPLTEQPGGRLRSPPHRIRQTCPGAHSQKRNPETHHVRMSQNQPEAGAGPQRGRCRGPRTWERRGRPTQIHPDSGEPYKASRPPGTSSPPARRPAGPALTGAAPPSARARVAPQGGPEPHGGREPPAPAADASETPPAAE